MSAEETTTDKTTYYPPFSLTAGQKVKNGQARAAGWALPYPATPEDTVAVSDDELTSEQLSYREALAERAAADGASPELARLRQLGGAGVQAANSAPVNDLWGGSNETALYAG